MNKFRYSVLAWLAVSFITPSAWAIQLDRHYGDAGYVQTNISSFNQATTDSLDTGFAMVAQADGKLVAGGYAKYGYGGLNTPTDMALTRHHSDGSLDAHFATGGRLIYSIMSPYSATKDLVLQADGALVSLVETYDGASLSTAMVRHSSNGTIDMDFGIDGVVDSGGNAVIQQADGKLVVMGNTLKRFDTFGVADAGFGTAGAVTPSVCACTRYSIVEQSDAKLVVVGTLGLERFTSSGQLDTTFGTGGQVLFSENAILPKVRQQADGSLIVAYIRSDRNTLFLSRYSADGVLDPSFGVAGTVSTLINDSGSSYNHSLVIQDDGKPVAFMRKASSSFLLVRYNTDGSLDNSFDSDGVYELPFSIGNSSGTTQVGDMVYQSGEFYVLVTHLDDFYITKFIEPVAPPVAGQVLSTNISQASFGESTYSLTIDYSDGDGDLDVSSIDPADITVCDGANCASVVGANWSGNASNGVATYTLTPPGGSWDAADIGIYTIAIAADEIADDLSTFVAADTNAGKFSVSMDAPPAPVASAVVAADVSQTDMGGSTHVLSIEYSDANGDLDVSSIDTTDITVCDGDNCASVDNVNWAGNASSALATYTLRAPGGDWDVADSGTYTIAISTNEVADTLSGFVAADANAGSFSVSLAVPTVPDPPTIGVARPADIAAWIAFTPPANNGGTPIIDYSVSCGTGHDTTGVASPLIAGWMTNGTTYYCYVTARNSVGSSAPSGTVSVTPTAYLSALTGTCAGTIAAGNHMLWGCSVPTGQTLTFEPGALLRGSNTIDVSGTVTADSSFLNGTNFVVQSGGVLNLNGVTYTGSSFTIRYLEGSSGSVTNSSLTMPSSGSLPYAIEIAGASPTINGNTIIADHGLLVSGDGANPTIEANNISFKKNGVTFSDAVSSGSVNNNTLNFLDASFATAIHVNGDASPGISNNIINDHNQQPGRGIRLDISAASSVQVTNNTICATNDDLPLLVDPDYFATGSTALISGNIFNCGGGRGISLGGTTTADGIFTAIQGQTELYLSSSLSISAGNTFTFNNGKIKGEASNNAYIMASGTFTASNSTIENTLIAALSGGVLNLDQMTLSGSAYSVRFLEGSDGSITDSQISATTFETIILTNTAPVISGNTFTGMPTSIAANNSSQTLLALNIQNNIFNDVVTGISLTGSIDASISDNQFNRNVSSISISGDAVTPQISNNDFIANDLSLSFLDDAALFSSASSFMQSNYFLSSSNAFNSIGMPKLISQSGVVPVIGAPLYYEVASTITIQNPIELTIPPGINFGFASNAGLSVEAGSRLIAGSDGSPEPVSFTGTPGSPSPWGGISVTGEASFSACIIQGAGFGLSITNGSVVVDDCSIMSNHNGVVVTGAGSSLLVTDSSVSDNSAIGIYRDLGEVTVSQSSITGNGAAGISSTDSIPYVMAQDNDWGHISGPFDSSDDTGTGGLYNPGGLGQGVSDYVNYDPWTGKTGPTVPDAPIIGAATPGDSVASITFLPPVNDGGEVIIDYTASCNAGTGSTGVASPLLVTGLSNDTSYNCYVTARNSLGNSAASGNVEVTPTAGSEVTLPPSEGGGGEVVTYTQIAAPPGGGNPIAATLSVVAAEANPPEPPPEADSLVSAIDISSTSAVIGYTLAVIFTIDASSINEFTGFWKYGKETSEDDPHWYDYGTLAANGDGTGYELSEDKKTLTIYLVDGLRGDDDLLANASIVDPALPIVQVSSLIFKNSFE